MSVSTRRTTPGTTARSTAGRLGGHLLSLGGAEVAGRGLSFVAMIVVARMLGPDSFGRLAFAQTVVLYLAALGDGGLTLWTQREIVRRPGELRRLVSRTLVAQLLLAAVAMAVLAGIAVTRPGETAVLIVAAAPVALAQALGTVYALQAMERMRLVAVVKLVTQAVAATAAVTLVLLTGRPVWVIMSMWFGLLAGAVLAYRFLVRDHGFRFEPSAWPGIRQTLAAGLPILGSLALVQYSQQLDTVVLGLLRGSYQVGIYAAAARLMMVAAVIALVIANSLYPEMVRRHAESDVRLGEFSGRALAVTLRLATAAATLTAVLAPVLVGALYGARFAAAVPMLRILAFLFPALAVNSLATQVLLAAGRNRQVLFGVGAGALVATVGIPAGSVAWGGIGTAIGFVGAMLAQCVALAWLARGPLTTGWISLLGKEIGWALALGAGTALGWLVAPGSPSVLVVAWLVTVLGIELLRGGPTLGVVAPRIRARLAGGGARVR